MHVEDAAEAYVLALTKGQAGAHYHIANQTATQKVKRNGECDIFIGINSLKL